MQAKRSHPELWRNFSYERTSKTSELRESLLYSFVSLSIPAYRTHRDVVEQIARESHIPIESLADELSQPLLTRGQAVFGFAGDELDKIAAEYDDMQWWLSDDGLKMAMVVPATVPRVPTFDELLGALNPGSLSQTPSEATAQVAPSFASYSGERRFRKMGDLWSLTFDGASVSVPHRIGLAYIALLLRSPSQSLSCLELQTAVGGSPNRRPRLDERDKAGLAVADSRGDEILDETARKQYKERLDRIERELGKADENNDPAQREILIGEKQVLIQELKAATGRAGRRRRFPTDAEKARKAVARAIETALKTIAKGHPRLARHLDDRVQRGGECCYKSDGIDWEV